MKSLVSYINEANNSIKDDTKTIELFEKIFSKMKPNGSGNQYYADKGTYCDELFKILNDSGKSVSNATAKKADAFITTFYYTHTGFEEYEWKEFYIYSDDKIFNKCNILHIFNNDTLEPDNFYNKEKLTKKNKGYTDNYWILSSDTINKIADLWNKYSK